MSTTKSSNEGSTLIQLSGLWKTKSTKGNTYYQGRIGNAVVMVMANPNKDSNEKAPEFNLLLRPFKHNVDTELDTEDGAELE